MGKVLDLTNSLYRIVPGRVEGDRCWGCCQENCGFRSCNCSCHNKVDGWHLVKGTKIVRESTSKEILENNLQYYIERDKQDN